MAVKDRLKKPLPTALIKSTKLTAVQKVGAVPKVVKETVIAVKRGRKK